MRARVVLALASCLMALTAGCELEQPTMPMPVVPLPAPAVGAAPTLEPVAADEPDAAVADAAWAYPFVCFKQWWTATELVPRTLTGGTGPRIAVIGDSLTTQSRERLVGRGGFQWRISSVCGAQIRDYLPGGRFVDELDGLAEFEPDVIVVALGTNDARLGASVPADAAALLALLPDGVPVAWVLPAPSHDDFDDEIAAARAAITNLHGVNVIDWASWADVPGTRLEDHIHLTWTGAGVYADLLAGGTRLVDRS